MSWDNDKEIQRDSSYRSGGIKGRSRGQNGLRNALGESASRKKEKEEEEGQEPTCYFKIGANAILGEGRHMPIAEQQDPPKIRSRTKSRRELRTKIVQVRIRGQIFYRG